MPNEPAYPEILESAWLRKAQEATGRIVATAAVAGLEREAEAISDGFTTGRSETITAYADSPRSVAAYGLYYFPRTFVRTRLVLRECAAALQHEGKEALRLYDLGAGTGAAGLAALMELTARNARVRTELHLVDQAPESLKAAETIFRECRDLWPGARVKTHAADARTFELEEGCDVIISSFCVNEWANENGADESLEAWVSGLLRKLKPGGLLVLMEPSQHESVERMIRLRDVIASQSKGNIIAPCPHHDACPMHAEKRGWCHEVRKWQAPESMHWINRNLKRDIQVLKFSMLVIQRSKPALPETPWMRLVSPVRKEKGKFVFHGCGADGNLHTCEWLNRKLSEEQLALSEALERGDRVLWHADKVLGDGRTERSDGPPEMIE